MFWNRCLRIVADVSSDSETDEHEEPDDKVIIAITLHSLVADPWSLISAMH